MPKFISFSSENSLPATVAMRAITRIEVSGTRLEVTTDDDDGGIYYSFDTEEEATEAYNSVLEVLAPETTTINF